MDVSGVGLWENNNLWRWFVNLVRASISDLRNNVEIFVIINRIGWHIQKANRKRKLAWGNNVNVTFSCLCCILYQKNSIISTKLHIFVPKSSCPCVIMSIRHATFDTHCRFIGTPDLHIVNKKAELFYVRTFPFLDHSQCQTCMLSTFGNQYFFLIFNYWDVACISDSDGIHWKRTWSRLNMSKVLMLLHKLCFSN